VKRDGVGVEVVEQRSRGELKKRETGQEGMSSGERKESKRIPSKIQIPSVPRKRKTE
jgi:hypothetical protein